MTAKLDRERTVRARAMALPGPQQKILLAYLAGAAAAAVESGLEFLAAIGVDDGQNGQDGVPATPATPLAAEPETETLIPCGDVRAHWPHARCPGRPEHADDTRAGRHLAPVPAVPPGLMPARAGMSVSAPPLYLPTRHPGGYATADGAMFPATAEDLW